MTGEAPSGTCVGTKAAHVQPHHYRFLPVPLPAPHRLCLESPESPDPLPCDSSGGFSPPFPAPHQNKPL